LVASRLLYLEAERTGLDISEPFLVELEEFRHGLSYRVYMNRLRARIEIPDEVKLQIRQQFAGDTDGRKAAEAAYRVDRFRAVKLANLLQLRQRFHVQVNEEAIRPDSDPDTILLAGDGLRVTLGDLLPETGGEPRSAEWIRDRLFERAELLLVARAAEELGLDLTERLTSFREERLPAMLLEQQEQAWVANEQTLRDYFQDHPELGQVLERWHIGQLVLSTRTEAETMRRRILDGESLFDLAGRHSTDPYGKSHKGDMGWVKAGQGLPAIEEAIARLQDGEVSEVIETPLGFHLVTIIERRPGERRPFPLVRDRVRQSYLSERLVGYMTELSERYSVEWQVLDGQVSQN
jgi:peptidyl-prolyl cis-trans isomerase C